MASRLARRFRRLLALDDLFHHGLAAERVIHTRADLVEPYRLTRAGRAVLGAEPPGAAEGGGRVAVDQKPPLSRPVCWTTAGPVLTTSARTRPGCGGR